VIPRSLLTDRNGILICGALAGSAIAALAMSLPFAGATTLSTQPVPIAACNQTIYSGSMPSAVFHTRHDVVVGPVRFGDLDPRLLGKIGGSSLLGIKSPMTVGPTQFSEVLVSVKGARGHVSIAYGQSPSTTTTTVKLLAQPDEVTVQAPASCGLPASGFVQYGGGFALAQKQCVTLTVSVPDGRVLARKTVPLGSVACASKT
jgi:hypothetical protein